jgi:DNA-binding GntR family transcriptional regulator
MSFNPLKKIIIDHRSKTPITEQLKQQIETLIQNNDLIAQDTLPNAKILAKQLSIKQKDVETTYKMLAQNQYIELNHEMPIIKYFDRVMDFLTSCKTIEEAISTMGLLAKVEVISINKEQLKLHLELDDSKLKKEYIVIKRIFYANDTPIIYMEDFYPLERYPEMERENLKNFKSIYKEIIQKKYQINITKTKRSISIIETSSDISSLLKISKKQAIIKADMIYYDLNHHIVASATGYSIPSYYLQTSKEDIL